mgnify:CR=1 FL=1
MHQSDYNDYKTMTLFNFYPKKNKLQYGLNSTQKEEQLNIKNISNKNIIHRNKQKIDKVRLSQTNFYSKDKNKLIASSSKLKFSQSKKNYITVQSRIKLYKTTENFYKENKNKIKINNNKNNNEVIIFNNEPEKKSNKKGENSNENQKSNKNCFYEQLLYKYKNKIKNSFNELNLMNQEYVIKKNNYLTDENSHHLYNIYQIQNLKNSKKSTFKFKTKENNYKKYYKNQLPLLKKKNNNKEQIIMKGINTELNHEKTNLKRLVFSSNYFKNNSNKENNILNENNKNINVINDNNFNSKYIINNIFSSIENKNEHNFSNNDKTNKLMNSTNSDFGNNNIIFNKTNTNSFYNSIQNNNKLREVSSTNSLKGEILNNIKDKLIYSKKNLNNEKIKENKKDEEKKLNKKNINIFESDTNFFMENKRRSLVNSNNNLNEIKYSLNAKKGFQKLEKNFNTIDSNFFINIIKYNEYNNNINSLHNKKNKLEKYKIGNILGKGAYATVKLVTNKLTNEKYAMKIYEKVKLNDNLKKKCVYKEIEILKRVNHKNIAKLIEVIHTEAQILIIQEFVKGISLRDYYNKEIRYQKGISEHKGKIFKKLFRQIFDAMNYLHCNYIAHRDIKLENILMTKEYEIKIIDFGFGMLNPENRTQYFFCGTPNYMPPEIVEKKGYIGQRADLWSLGVLVYKIYCADFPFKGRNEKDLYKSIKRCQFYIVNYVPENVKKIIRALIEYDPFKRPTCKEVLKSEWLSN